MPLILSSLASPTSSSINSNLALNLKKNAATSCALKNGSNRLLKYRDSTRIDAVLHYYANETKQPNNIENETINKQNNNNNIFLNSRRRNSSSVAPAPKFHKTVVLTTIPSSNSVNDKSLYAPEKRNGYSLDRNENKNNFYKMNQRRRESKIKKDDIAFCFQKKHLSPASSASVSPTKFTSSSSSSELSTVTQHDIITNKRHINEKIISRSGHVSRLSSRSAFYRLYEIGGLIGQGNFSNVYLVYSENNGLKYAVKEINKARMYGKLHFIENEISILKQCEHKNICKSIEAFECENFYFIVFEYAEKGDLFETIKRMGRLNEKYAAQITFQVSDALHYMHSKKIVHRDIKPENILLGPNFCAKLTDFGLACTVAGPLYRVCGTPTYVAPEILTQQGYGIEVDIWSLGVLLYVMLIGFAPFRCLDRSILFRLIVKAKVSFSMPTWTKISLKAKQLILKMLTLNVKNRITAFETLNNDWIRHFNKNPN